MIDDDLRRLNERPLDHTLDGLESDIWREHAMRVQHRVVARRSASLQGAVMALSLIVSIAIGIYTSRPAVSNRERATLALGLDLAPSSLLFGNRR